MLNKKQSENYVLVPREATISEKYKDLNTIQISESNFQIYSMIFEKFRRAMNEGIMSELEVLTEMTKVGATVKTIMETEPNQKLSENKIFHFLSEYSNTVSTLINTKSKLIDLVFSYVRVFN